MTDTGVKAGQVWQHKNSGRRLEVVRGVDDEYSWVVRNATGADSEERPITEWVLTDDYILVVDVP